jgi:hypothetical protein
MTTQTFGTRLHLALAAVFALAAAACAGKQPAHEPEHMTIEGAQRVDGLQVACRDAGGTTTPVASRDGTIKCPLQPQNGRLLGGATMTCKEGTKPVLEKAGNTGRFWCKPTAP